MPPLTAVFAIGRSSGATSGIATSAGRLLVRVDEWWGNQCHLFSGRVQLRGYTRRGENERRQCGAQHCCSAVDHNVPSGWRRRSRLAAGQPHPDCRRVDLVFDPNWRTFIPFADEKRLAERGHYRAAIAIREEAEGLLIGVVGAAVATVTALDGSPAPASFLPNYDEMGARAVHQF